LKPGQGRGSKQGGDPTSMPGDEIETRDGGRPARPGRPKSPAPRDIPLQDDHRPSAASSGGRSSGARRARSGQLGPRRSRGRARGARTPTPPVHGRASTKGALGPAGTSTVARTREGRSDSDTTRPRPSAENPGAGPLIQRKALPLRQVEAEVFALVRMRCWRSPSASPATVVALRRPGAGSSSTT
jgi:hypothetical protein